MRWNIYLKSDFSREFSVRKICLGIIGVCILLGIEMIELISWSDNLLSLFLMLEQTVSYKILVIVPAWIFGVTICEDLENGYYNWEIIRGDRKRYVLSKTMVIAGATIVVTVLGISIFLFLVSWNMSMRGPEEAQYQLYMQDIFLNNNMDWAYYIFQSIQKGIENTCWVGLSVYFSLYYSNKLFLASMPVFINYILDYIKSVVGINNILGFQLIINCFFAFLVGLAVNAIIGKLIYNRLMKLGN